MQIIKKIKLAVWNTIIILLETKPARRFVPQLFSLAQGIDLADLGKSMAVVAFTGLSLGFVATAALYILL
jgi:hypothetical protein